MKDLIYFLLTFLLLSFLSCKDDDESEKKREGEVITDVRLIFSPVGDGAPLTVRASDQTGEGANNLVPEGPINLSTNTSYQLFIQLENTLTEEDIDDEIEATGDKHLFLFEFTDELYANPSGDGNVDGREPQSVEYQDSDVNDQPIGLITAWVTGEAAEGTFRVVLGHLDTKTETSTVADGFADLDITWQVTIN